MYKPGHPDTFPNAPKHMHVVISNREPKFKKKGGGVICRKTLNKHLAVRMEMFLKNLKMLAQHFKFML